MSRTEPPGVRLIVLDVDGTMTDGGLYLDGERGETKRFCIRDGGGVLLARSVGVSFMILTGRSVRCVEQRAEELGITLIFQGVQDKAAFLRRYLDENGLSRDTVGYIGDDLNDLAAMRLVGVSACPSDACPEVRDFVSHVLPVKGGEGAVRAFVELLLRREGLWEAAVEKTFGFKLRQCRLDIPNDRSHLFYGEE